MRIALYLILSLTVLSCINSGFGEKMSDDSNDSDTIDLGDDDGYYSNSGKDTIIDEYFDDPVIKSYTSESDTLVIAENCVVFLWPDSLEIEEIKVKYPDGYSEILDDMIYYASEAAMSLDEAGIKNFFCDKSVIQFKGDKKDTFLKRKKVEGNMILFKYGEKPVISNAIDFDLAVCTKFFAPEIIEDTVSVE